MKRISILITLYCMVGWAFAQKPNYGKMSQFVRKASIDFSSHQGHNRTAMLQSSWHPVVTAFVSIPASETNKILQKYGCKKHAQWGDISIAEIPITNLAGLSAEPLVRRIEAGEPASVNLDTTATVVNVLPVYQPTATHQAYTGAGVMMGLIDIGFDLTHPNFRHTETRDYRIKALWDQLSKDTVGSMLPVGRDYLNPDEILALEHTTDGATEFHGTHTLGIAAGNGYDTPYRGLAYESDICLVSNAVSSNLKYIDAEDRYKYTTATNALAYKYLFDYAESQGKPCVVSMSEGYTPYLDQDDSLYSAVLDSLSGPGRIIVAAAGNNGLERSYVNKPAETTEVGAFIRSFSKEAFYRMTADGPLRIHLYVYREAQAPPTDTLTFDSDILLRDSIYDDTLRIGTDTLSVRIWHNISSFPCTEEIYQFLVKGNRTLDNLPHIALTLEGDYHAEMFGSRSSAFTRRDTDPRWTADEKGHDILAPSCFPSVICVGAISHRMHINNIFGEAIDIDTGDTSGLITPSSSTGPAMNGLLKPDVTAPGTHVISSYSSFVRDSSWVVGFSDYAGRSYPWAACSGTSMSAPVVAGTIALWLQAKPDLTAADVRELLSKTCRQPEPQLPYPNNLYGYGEIDAYKGLLSLLGIDGIKAISSTPLTNVRVKVGNGQLNIIADGDFTGQLTISIYALSGIRILQERKQAQGNEVVIPLGTCPAGVYAIQIESADGRFCGSQLIRI